MDDPQSRKKPWYRSTVGVVAISVWACGVVYALGRDGMSNANTGTARAVAAAEVAPDQAAPVVPAAPKSEPSLPPLLLAQDQIQPAVERFLGEKYRDGSYKVRKVQVERNAHGAVVLQVQLKTRIGLTASMARDRALMEMGNFFRELSSSPSMGHLVAYIVEIYFEATDVYMQKTETLGIGMFLRAEDAKRTNWGNMTSADDLARLLRAKGKLHLHAEFE